MKKTKLAKIASVIAASAACAALGIAAIGCGDDDGHTHKWETGWTTSTTHHWHACPDCDEKSGYDKHDPADENGLCPTCKYVLSTPTPGDDEHDHAWATTWTTSETHHWHACTEVADCEEVNDKAEHLDTNEDGECDVCDKEVGEKEEADTALLTDSFYLVGSIAAVGHDMWAATIGYRADKGIKIHLTPNDTFKVMQYKGATEQAVWLNDVTAPTGVLSQYSSDSLNAKVAEEGDYIVKGYADHFLVYKVGTNPDATCNIKGSWTNSSWENAYGMKSVTPTDDGVLYQFEYTIKIQNPDGANFGVQFYTKAANTELSTGWCNTIADGSIVETATVDSEGVYKFTVCVTADGNSIKVENATDGTEDVTAPYVDPNATTETTLTVKLSATESFTLNITHPVAFAISGIHVWGGGANTGWPGAPIEDGVVDLSGNTGAMSMIIVASNGDKQTATISDTTFVAGTTYTVTITQPGEGTTEFGVTIV